MLGVTGGPKFGKVKLFFLCVGGSGPPFLFGGAGPNLLRSIYCFFVPGVWGGPQFVKVNFFWRWVCWDGPQFAKVNLFLFAFGPAGGPQFVKVKLCLFCVGVLGWAPSLLR